MHGQKKNDGREPEGIFYGLKSAILTMVMQLCSPSATYKIKIQMSPRAPSRKNKKLLKEQTRLDGGAREIN